AKALHARRGPGRPRRRMHAKWGRWRRARPPRWRFCRDPETRAESNARSRQAKTSEIRKLSDPSARAVLRRMRVSSIQLVLRRAAPRQVEWRTQQPWYHFMQERLLRCGVPTG